MILPWIDVYSPYHGILLTADNNIDISGGSHYPCDLGQRFRRKKDGIIIQLTDWTWEPVPEKIISGVVIVEVTTGKIGNARILKFLEALKNKDITFFSPEPKKKYF